MFTPRKTSSASLVEARIPRTHKTTVMWTSQHPEYNINEDLPRFTRGPNGSRLAPVSQYNSAAGRELAQEHTTGQTMGSGSAFQNNLPGTTPSTNAEPTRPRNFSLTLSSTHKHCGRDALPSQNPLFSPYIVSHDTSHAFIATGRPVPIHHPISPTASVSQVPPPPTQKKNNDTPCPLCNQTSSSPSPSSTFSHICRECKRFVFLPPPAAHFAVAALQPTKPQPPIPPRKNIPQALKCVGCVAVPGYLVEELDRVCAGEEMACLICGCLSREGIAELGAGGLAGLGASGKMKAWLEAVAAPRQGRDGGSGGVERSPSEPSGSALAEDVVASRSAAKGASLRRTGAVKRGKERMDRAGRATPGRGKPWVHTNPFLEDVSYIRGSEQMGEERGLSASSMGSFWLAGRGSASIGGEYGRGRGPGCGTRLGDAGHRGGAEAGHDSSPPVKEMAVASLRLGACAVRKYTFQRLARLFEGGNAQDCSGRSRRGWLGSTPHTKAMGRVPRNAKLRDGSNTHRDVCALVDATCWIRNWMVREIVLTQKWLVMCRERSRRAQMPDAILQERKIEASNLKQQGLQDRRGTKALQETQGLFTYQPPLPIPAGRGDQGGRMGTRRCVVLFVG
ncbi:uncharacterized protein CC84DRAFT_1173866 [Paraphaeosphaeria sporulosa]|uniref:Uncharacterized protein n=1 Tax=Paraphaeosphaeria sporulosa TaxID=1460663 RepID=A0A177CLI2_9PLEO|nr:uncharacterized protein CC84DRAFT_1173866 [Paraphaeosphaeria sporulosa]OAG08373.1 hypothetical protein CC84DRAFT_1173866 [Paraphaeosphaeria sporulosa]